MNYTKSLYLPNTAFPQRGKMPERELPILTYWDKLGVYAQDKAAKKSGAKFTIQDGPPYANGHIHLGHALNKVLKDAIGRYESLSGKSVSFIPGWDAHGLPIESLALSLYKKEGRKRANIPVLEFRARCRALAMEWVEKQKEEFKRLGIKADWDNPYITAAPKSEARIAKNLLTIFRSGLLYRASKPVLWSVAEGTTLAEAETEYRDMKTKSIWVSYPVVKAQRVDVRFSDIIIWTTTPWTLPASRAVAFNPAASYGLYAGTARKIVIADASVADIEKLKGFQLRRIRTIAAEELAEAELAHPLSDVRHSDYSYYFEPVRIPMLPRERVKETDGTGFVHIAPSCGLEDYNDWLESAELLEQRGISREIEPLIDGNSEYLNPMFKGLRVLTASGADGGANAEMIYALGGSEKWGNKVVWWGNLFAEKDIVHSAPISWRSKTPLLYRNTPQWFIKLSDDSDGDVPLLGLSSMAQLNIEERVSFIPASGRARLRSMMENRPDWCVSRQRVWGVPIPLFVNDNGDILADDAVDKRILEIFAEESSDSWFAEGAEERFLGDAHKGEGWRQVKDILDVWFDSGCAWSLTEDGDSAEPLKRNPADIYLEGSDQHRGWFQSSAYIGCAVLGRVPFKTLLTHGFITDSSGRKMSKSEGNAISPQKIIDAYGADVLRLTLLSADWSGDVRISDETVRGAADAYKRFRNNIRWALGMAFHNNAIFNKYPAPSTLNRVSCGIEDYMYALLKVKDKEIEAAYAARDMKKAVRLILDFVSKDFSAFYADIRKDALYCDKLSSPRRIAGQAFITAFLRWVLWRVAPILPFTAEEIWQVLDKESVRQCKEYLGLKASSLTPHLEKFFTLAENDKSDESRLKRWAVIRELKALADKQLEEMRRSGAISTSLQVKMEIISGSAETIQALSGTWPEMPLADIFMVAGCTYRADFEQAEKVKLVFKPADGKKCRRCWKWSERLGKDERR